MAPPAVYRVPRRFITFPADPPPYGPLAASFLGHMLVLGGALVLSAMLGTRLDPSRVYIVNLVPATPSPGSPAAAPTPAPPAPASARPRPAPRPAPAPKVEPKAEEKAPPRPARPEPPPRPVERVVEPPPPRAPDIVRPRTLEPSELALPRRAEKELPAPAGAGGRPVERALPPPPPVTPAPATPSTPAAPPRLPEPPRIAAPPAAPAAPTIPPPSVAAARTGVDPIRLGRPSAPSTATGSIAVDASDFPFTYYLRLIQSKIGERWSPPRAAAAGGERTVILFEIQRDGQVTREPMLERSSGNALYDQSALRAVMEASPFPPLPPEFKASSLRVHFGFEFQPEQG
jgi:TonB family protein